MNPQSVATTGALCAPAPRLASFFYITKKLSFKLNKIIFLCLFFIIICSPYATYNNLWLTPIAILSGIFAIYLCSIKLQAPVQRTLMYVLFKSFATSDCKERLWVRFQYGVINYFFSLALIARQIRWVPSVPPFSTQWCEN